MKAGGEKREEGERWRKREEGRKEEKKKEWLLHISMGCKKLS